MHLGGAVVDAHGADLAAQDVERHVLGHAHSSPSLHRLVDGISGHFCGVELEHAGLGLDVHALVLLPRAVQSHHPSGMNLRGEIGDPPLDRLFVRELGAEDNSLVGLLDEHFKGAAGDADGPCGHLQSPACEPHLHRRKSRANRAEQVSRRDPAILERDFEGQLSAKHLDGSRDRHARGAGVHEEGGDAAGTAIARVGLRHHDDVVHGVAARDPNFGSVQKPAVSLPHCLHRHHPGVGTSSRFGNADR
mmetsp:Transcript_70707/g.229750  ORF Transcript_70707/g.229750 Transcript_70707/m.229750 type:complete len:248 (-) Transcript_70707:572-1315(-)